MVSSQESGLYSAGNSKYTVETNASHAKSLAPFHSANQFPHRSVFGLFPEYSSWFKLDSDTDWTNDRERMAYGYHIPTVVSIFHRLPELPKLVVSLPGSSGASSSTSTSIKNKTRNANVDAVDPEVEVPNPSQKPHNPNLVTPPMSDSGEPEMPAVTADRKILAPKSSEEEGPKFHADWTTFD